MKEISNKTKQYDAIRDLAATDLFFFLVYVLNRKDANRQFVLDRCREYEQNPYGYLDLWARFHYKSTIITFAYTLQELARNPELTVCIFSHTKTIARSFLRQIKTELETNKKLCGLFPEAFFDDPERESRLWSKDEGIIVKRKGNPKEASIEAWGVVDGQPTSKHFDRLKYDDLVTLESVNTPEQIEKCDYGYRMSLNLGNERTLKSMAGTFYAANDPYTRLIGDGLVVPRIHRAMKVIGDFSTGVMMTAQRLQDIYRDLGRDVFSTQMMLDPSVQSGQMFTTDWLSFYNETDWRQMNRYIFVDPAGSKGKKSDYTVIWVIGFCRDGCIYVLDGVRDRLSLAERTRRLFDFVQQYAPQNVFYERYGLQADVEHIKLEQERLAYRFRITEVGGSEPKKNRIQKLQSPFEERRLILPKTLYKTLSDGKRADLIRQFINEEFKQYPATAHDDMLDCMARCIDERCHFPKRKVPTTRFYNED